MHPLLSVGTSNKAIRKLLPLGIMNSSFSFLIAKTEGALVRGKNKFIRKETCS